jgi:polyhydroxyalkanoate synthesis regulator phasin
MVNSQARAAGDAQRLMHQQLSSELEQKKKWRHERMAKAKTLSPDEWKEVAVTNRAIQQLEKRIRDLLDENPALARP